jgi:hypothetical protein
MKYGEKGISKRCLVFTKKEVVCGGEKDGLVFSEKGGVVEVEMCVEVQNSDGVDEIFELKGLKEEVDVSDGQVKLSAAYDEKMNSAKPMVVTKMREVPG